MPVILIWFFCPSAFKLILLVKMNSETFFCSIVRVLIRMLVNTAQLYGGYLQKRKGRTDIV